MVGDDITYNNSGLRHNSCYLVDDILNAFSSMRISAFWFKFHLIINQHFSAIGKRLNRRQTIILTNLMNYMPWKKVPLLLHMGVHHSGFQGVIALDFVGYSSNHPTFRKHPSFKVCKLTVNTLCSLKKEPTTRSTWLERTKCQGTNNMAELIALVSNHSSYGM